MCDSIIVDGRNPTIEYGMKMLQCPATSKNSILSKQIGLQLTILGVAEIQAKRISNLAVATYELEQKLYSPEILQTIDSKKLLATYQAVNTALTEALNYVQSTQGMDWNTIVKGLQKIKDDNEDDLAVGNPEDDDNKRTISRTAKELLALANSKIVDAGTGG